MAIDIVLDRNDSNASHVYIGGQFCYSSPLVMDEPGMSWRYEVRPREGVRYLYAEMPEGPPTHLSGFPAGALAVIRFKPAEAVSAPPSAPTALPEGYGVPRPIGLPEPAFTPQPVAEPGSGAYTSI